MRYSGPRWAILLLAERCAALVLGPVRRRGTLRYAIMMVPRAVTVVWLSVWLVACRAGDESATVASAGSHAALQEVDIGGTAADTVLMMPTAATRLSNGVIVIADPFVPAIRYFSPDGKLIRSVGRKGEGPGEFEVPRWLRQCGTDSVFVWDAGQMRMTVLDGAGSMVRQFKIESVGGALECSRRGVLVAIGPPLSGRAPSLRERRVSGPLVILDREGRAAGSFGVVPHWEFRPLGRFTSLAVSDSLLFMGTADSAWVDVLSLQGTHLGGISVGGAPREPTERHYDLAIEAAANQFANRGDRETAKAMERQMFPEPPEALPPYAGLFIDPDEVLWAVTSFAGDAVTVLQAVTATGEKLGEVRLPRYIQVFEVGRGYVLGAYETEEGVPHVALYRLPTLEGGT